MKFFNDFNINHNCINHNHNSGNILFLITKYMASLAVIDLLAIKAAWVWHVYCSKTLYNMAAQTELRTVEPL